MLGNWQVVWQHSLQNPAQQCWFEELHAADTKQQSQWDCAADVSSAHLVPTADLSPIARAVATSTAVFFSSWVLFCSRTRSKGMSSTARTVTESLSDSFSALPKRSHFRRSSCDCCSGIGKV